MARESFYLYWWYPVRHLQAMKAKAIYQVFMFWTPNQWISESAAYLSESDTVYWRKIATKLEVRSE
jgi:hypothetical protein